LSKHPLPVKRRELPVGASDANLKSKWAVYPFLISQSTIVTEIVVLETNLDGIGREFNHQGF
jgi:hypothetical protein